MSSQFDSKPESVGRRYSKRQVQGAFEIIDDDAHHLLRPKTIARMKKWALDVLADVGVDVDHVLATSAANGMTNEGEGLRHHVAAIEGLDHDDMPTLAARIYELCRLIELHETDDWVRQWVQSRGGAFRVGYELGRLTMLAQVYGIDNAGVDKRAAGASKENRKYTAAERAEWHRLRAEPDCSQLSDRSAARLIATREGRPASEIEAIRKELGKKVGST